MKDLNFHKTGLTQRAQAKLYFGTPTAGVKSTLELTVLDYSLLSGATLQSNDLVGTIDITEGTDYDAETDNATTATNLAAALDALPNISAAAVGAVVTVTVDEPGIGLNGIVVTSSVEAGIDSAAFAGGVTADVVIVDGTPFYCVESNPDSNEFTDIAELEALIEAVTGITSSVVSDSFGLGDYILIQASAVGTAGNALTLQLPSTNTGTMSTDLGDVGEEHTLEGGTAADYSDWFDLTTEEGVLPVSLKGELVVANIGGTSPHVIVTPQFSEDKVTITDGTPIDKTSNSTTAISVAVIRRYVRYKVVLTGANATADVALTGIGSLAAA